MTSSKRTFSIVPGRAMLSHYRELTVLGVPIVIGQLGTIILGFADTLMVGHHSTAELAAASFVNNMFMLVLIFALGFSYGLTPIVGSLFGKGDSKAVGRAVKNSMSANGLIALMMMVVMAVLYFNIDNMGQPEELIPLMKPYFAVNFVSLPFVVLFNTFKQFFDGITRTKVAMWVMITGNLINIGGNYILIYGKLGMPEMGLLGAGISTTVSRVAMALVMVGLFFTEKQLKEYREGFYQNKVTKAEIMRFNHLGWPIALQMGMETAAFSLCSVMVGWIGTTALAAHQVMLTISQLFYMIYYGMAAAVSVKVSNYHGRKDYHASSATANAGLHIILLIAVCLSVPIFLLRNHLGALFTDNHEVSLLVAALFIPLVVYQFSDGLQCTYANALRGLAYVKPMMFIAFVAYFVVSLPMSYLLGIKLGYGLQGIWYSFPFGLTIAGVLYYIYFRKRLSFIQAKGE